MKLTHILLLLFVFNNSYLVKGQNIENSKPNENEIKNFYNLCKVWGFLKYYHPNVAKGSFNWDEHLLTILPKIENAKNTQEISKIYIDWIDSLGDIKECKTCKTINSKDSFDKNFNLSWTQDRNVFSDELTKKLKYIENNRFQGKSYYISTASNGNIVVENEPEYKDFEYPSRNFRLLSLFKYWNTIEYFYPYKYLTDLNWDEVLLEMIPRFIDSKSEMEYHLAMLETVVKLDDGHGLFKTKFTIDFFGSKFIPAKLKIIENKAIVTGFYNDSLSKINNIQIGDIIEKINDKSIKDIIEEKLKYTHGSNPKSKTRDTYYTIANGNTDSLVFYIERNGKKFIKTIHRYPYDLIFKTNYKKEKYKIIENNIGYVDMSTLEMKDVDQMMKTFENTKAIIIDIRNYPNFIPYLISNYLNSEKKDFVKIIIPDLKYPGKFIWKQNGVTGKNNKDYYKGKVVLLVNEETQSRAEFSVMCLQTANNVITIGSQTAGADGNLSFTEFIGGYKSFFSGTGIYYPDETITQRKGVKIDIEVNQTIKGIQEGRDEILERALEYLR